MNILHVYRTFFPESQGGLEEAIRQIAINTAAYGVQTRVLVPSNSGNRSIEVDGVSVYSFKRHGVIASCDWSFSALPTFAQQCQWADLVNLHFPWPFADLLCAVGKVNKPYIVTYHSDIVRQRWLMRLYQPLMDITLRKAARLVATSNSYADTSNTLSRFAGNVSVIPLGLSEPREFKENGANGLGCLPNEFVLFIGVLRYYKGLQHLIDAAKAGGFNLLIAGEGPERPMLQDRAKSLSLNNVSFLGRVTDKQKYYLLQRCLAFVLPSDERSEAFGVSLIEAAMCGKPMVSCELGTGTSYVNLHNETGLVVKPKDPAQLRLAIEQLQGDAELRARFGRRARERYEELFSGGAFGRAYAKLYHSVLGDAGSPAR